MQIIYGTVAKSRHVCLKKFMKNIAIYRFQSYKAKCVLVDHGPGMYYLGKMRIFKNSWIRFGFTEKYLCHQLAENNKKVLKKPEFFKNPFPPKKLSYLSLEIGPSFKIIV